MSFRPYKDSDDDNIVKLHVLYKKLGASTRSGSAGAVGILQAILQAML